VIFVDLVGKTFLAPNRQRVVVDADLDIVGGQVGELRPQGPLRSADASAQLVTRAFDERFPQSIETRALLALRTSPHKTGVVAFAGVPRTEGRVAVQPNLADLTEFATTPQAALLPLRSWHVLYTTDAQDHSHISKYLYVDCPGRGQFKPGRYFAGQAGTTNDHPLRSVEVITTRCATS
jgi:hypothetical protein